MFLTPFTLVLLPGLFSLVSAGSQQKDQNCSVADNRLQTGTYQFWSDCDSETFCGSDGICQLKGCRRDDFPFGYPQDGTFPDKCPKGEFCPDEEDACQSLQPVGSPCQLNRDDQCEAPPNFSDLADRSALGLNFNGSVCLNGQCMWANATLGNTCVVENTAYIAYGSGQEFIDIVSRGNCKIGLYCDSAQTKCLQTKDLGVSCDADKECSSYNCLASGVCGRSASSPNHVGTWVYAIVAIGIFGGMFGTLITLFILHRRQRDTEREKRLQYWREQNAFRQNIMQMRETARASILSLPTGRDSARSTIYGAHSDESQAPILQHAAPKASGLRHHLSDDGSVDYDDQLVLPADNSRF